jgi:hypothetical protein
VTGALLDGLCCQYGGACGGLYIGAYGSAYAPRCLLAHAAAQRADTTAHPARLMLGRIQRGPYCGAYNGAYAFPCDPEATDLQPKV